MGSEVVEMDRFGKLGKSIKESAFSSHFNRSHRHTRSLKLYPVSGSDKKAKPAFS